MGKEVRSAGCALSLEPDFLRPLKIGYAKGQIEMALLIRRS
jgi:hypothetical protein